ncbi:MAG: bifunctional enoyl-CoA hydratase/phosphate acetyltransferase [Deltaproteobacteria bacterium ADurb.BinA179]|jgi:acyl dehydratase|nr:MaoC/PaaZ C-terminal domain-containing protein [Pseudomonadota bacterium]NLW68076.1 dehydratase [Bacteriovoracaceae bacterium]OPZ23406.1 MAG: bifunctional enoyl-CoA hydratase/phosphate acetyltransferase [Deltaproteobacteria bacterium ADurb.BinA179]HNU73792.1 MaoC/PaaZ C-terminal domain-containing protein [Deltaproteobacteria bacterium]HOD72215.1 MaoC/PaaZ C-terminal domain-containing protein [Deltaproteobacteria bacterium]
MGSELYFEDVKVGDAMPALSKGPVAKLQHVMYAGASGDFNPLHTDDDFARAVGMKDGVISHGMLIMGFVGQAITAWVPRKYLKKFGVRFAGMTKPGNTITITGKVTDKRQENGENLIFCEVVAQDENGDVKITGNFSAALPSKRG